MEVNNVFRLNNRKAKNNELRKKHLVRNWIASFAITSVVVVTQILSPLKPPTAEFNRVGTFSDSIYYGVTVSDVSNSILPDTLKIIITSQYDNFEIPLNIGMNTGVVNDLRENTLYDILVVGSRGYGSEVLAKEKLTTVQSTGGAILDAELRTSDLSLYELEYAIHTRYQDDLGIYESVKLKYCILYHEMGEEAPEVCQDYEEILLSELMQISLINVPNYNVTVYLELEAIMASTQSAIVLDAYEFKTPLLIDGYLYIDDVTDQSIEVSCYVDFDIVQGISYWLELYQNDELIKTTDLEKNLVDDHNSQDRGLLIEGLSKETVYTVKLMTSYQDPITSELIIKEVMTETAETSPYYQFNVAVTETSSIYVINIVIDDEQNILHNFYYYIYDVSGEYPIYMSSNPIEMILTNEGQKTSSFEVMIPIDYPYQIVFVSDKIINPDTTYYSIIFYEINHGG